MFRAAALVLAALALTGCKDRQHYVAPPPPQVSVTPAVRQKITRYLQTTGSVAAVNSVDLVARIPGFVQEIDYRDGALVHKGDTLFVIEPLPYQSKLKQAQAQQAQQQALYQQAADEYQRQATLGRSDNASRSAVEQALANRDAAQGQLAATQAATQQAAINYTYTRVAAPMDGVASAHLVSVGELVGDSGATKLASVVQLDPVYVNFNVAERDALLIRAQLARRGLTVRELGAVPVEAGLQIETGTPHTGVLDYVAPGIDPSTGTLAVRGVFANHDRALPPGAFVRVRVPEQRDVQAVLVPDVALQADQGGRYLLVVGHGNIVEQRPIVAGPTQGALRIIESGLEPGEQVIVGGLQRAVPGQKVAPVPAAPGG